MSNTESDDVAAFKTTRCWNCGRQRYEFESCHHCGASCKPRTKRKQQLGTVPFSKESGLDD